MSVTETGHTRELVERTDGRADLEALSGCFVTRLHRRSDDFDATYGLRLVAAKLQHVPYGPRLVTTAS